MSKSKQVSQCKIWRTSSKPQAGDATCLAIQMSHHFPCSDRRVGPGVFCNLSVMKAQKSSKCVAACEQVRQTASCSQLCSGCQQSRTISLEISRISVKVIPWLIPSACSTFKSDKMMLVLVFVTIPTSTPPRPSSLGFVNVRSWGSYSLLALYRKVRRGPVNRELVACQRGIQVG